MAENNIDLRGYVFCPTNNISNTGVYFHISDILKIITDSQKDKILHIKDNFLEDSHVRYYHSSSGSIIKSVFTSNKRRVFKNSIEKFESSCQKALNYINGNKSNSLKSKIKEFYIDKYKRICAKGYSNGTR